MARSTSIRSDIVTLGSGVVDNTAVSSTSGQEISATKLHQVHKPFSSFGLAIGGTPATAEYQVYTPSGAATVRGFWCQLEDSGTSTDIDFDVLVNNSSILSAAVNFVHGDGDGTVKAGTISSPTLAADDIVTLKMTVTSATGALGPFAWIEVDEIPA